MKSQILALEDIRQDDVSIAGGKGANLGELIWKGFPVPAGFVIPAQTCEVFFRHIGLEHEIRNLKDASHDDIEKSGHAIRQKIEKADLPSGLAESIMAAHGELINKRGADIMCAVRSSGTAEDLGEASFAGQHETYYYVEADRLLQMVKHCWASLWSPEAVSYRSSQGIDHGSVFMAVVVQEMIMSEVSGVTFTANPVTGSRSEIVIESSWGMGAAIVDGRVTPDHYIVERDGLKLREKRIAEKRFLVVSRLDKGSTSRLQEVPHGMRQKETLSMDQVRTAAEWAVRAEEHFGNPQDIEWAFAEGHFHMLQSRPITVMGHEEIGQGVKGKYVLFKSLIENFTEPLTPLTSDLMEIVLIPSVRFIRGWLYTNLKHVRPFLPYKLSDEQLADLLYMSYGTQPPSMKISFLWLPVSLLCFSLGYLFFGAIYIRSRRMPDDFMDNYRELSDKIDKDPSTGYAGALARLWTWSRFFDPIGNIVILVNITMALRYPVWRGLLNKILRRWLPDIREDAEDLLCSGSEGVLSADMGRGIWSLAQEAKRHRPVRELLEKHKPDKVLAALQGEPEAKAFVEQLDRFLARHGHRALKEFELQSVRWEEDPAPVLGMVRNYMLVDSDPSEHEEKVNRMRAQLEKEIRKALEKYPLERTVRLRWRIIRYIKARAKYFTKQRENSRFYHIMAFNIARKKILKVETELLSQGKLKCKGDIFFLKKDELAQLRAGRLGWFDVEDRIRDRRIEHIRLSKMVPPKTIGVIIEEKPQIVETADEDASVLRGQSAAPGHCEGIAHVIIDPSIDIELKPGEILVAPYTDPAWTPLFLTAGAAVVEVGSYLSHAGTVAREFGMPCVVDVSDCTRRIHSGVKVKVDGDRGVVRLGEE
ncbi:MAG: hypothetical protein JRJ85_03960 [Deltaproteobacteria bacterium]|nr:hypothetical protein [Deltaproteobacteria bacterium]